jgi:hypothetical protein
VRKGLEEGVLELQEAGNLMLELLKTKDRGFQIKSSFVKL